MKIEKTINILNKRAKFEYEILEQLEAGIVLTGTEIKALRSSKASITESFCQFIEGELYVINMSIDEYKLGTFYNHKIKRERKLLLHKENCKNGKEN
jgi:SsrA-binding protein